ncbi:AAA domain-containing protein [Verrucomicrobium sp. 3C]|uniref:AAA domain-containing protein n=1 Tax=Verrucomicrobium sp. 3C TaxID=1134055 RepID=UPI00036B99DD|nr:AAA domain-containing protein [Verrucomicrobium sp. 3C]
MIGKKDKALLSFLKETAWLRQKRISAYEDADRLLWLADLPRDLPQTWRDACRSAFIADNAQNIPDLWLEVRKKHRPRFPPLSKELQDWISQRFQDHPEEYIDKEPSQLIDLLNLQMTPLIDKRLTDPDARPGGTHASVEKLPEVRHLKDYPQVQDAWLEYLDNQWKPWAQEMRWWKQVQDVYETADFMHRRLEEAEERYELLLAVGLLQWRDSTGSTVKRHLLTAPAEITLDAGRGVLGVGPGTSFESFSVELDMLELQDQPRLQGTDIEDLLEELDVRAWDKARVAEILRIIANKASADGEVDENAWKPFERPDEIFRILYAPALVLRERRPKAYEELIGRFLQAYEGEAALATTAPWDRFVSEGGPSSYSAVGGLDADFDLSDGDDGRLYYPLPTNDEQRRIVECLRKRPYVLVKGPPGTGKSHTIANLICHLLATGKRVLVTAHAHKALTVLRDLLPPGIRDLCVTALGSSREDHRLLEDSVRGILSRKSEWRGEERARGEIKIERLEKELRELDDGLAEIDRQLRECREAETHSHSLPGGYHGTAAQIARRSEKERDAYGWFPELPDDQNCCPLQPEDIEFLADVHAALTEERLKEIRLEIGAFSLPNPGEFAEAIEKLSTAERAAEVAHAGLREEQLGPLEQFSEETLEACRACLSQLEERATRAGRILGVDLTDKILKDLLAGGDARWGQLAREVTDLINRIDAARGRAGAVPIHLPSDVDEAELLADARRRREHFGNGGRRGLWFLVPRVVRETCYVEERCRVDGSKPYTPDSLAVLVGFLELRACLKEFYKVWPASISPRLDDPRRAARMVSELDQELRHLLELFRSLDRVVLETVPADRRVALAERDERSRWRCLIDAELARRQVLRAREPVEAWRRAIKSLRHEDVHPCMTELAQASENRDLQKWNDAWHVRESLRLERDRLRRYQELLDTIRVVCPQLVSLLREAQGNPDWKGRLHHLKQAWAWAAARAWLRRVTDPTRYEELTRINDQLPHRIEEKIKELSALKAWKSFFERLDDTTEQNLTAWTKVVARIGKGTGKHAYKHRRTARQYLMACIPKMPAWIMPLHKVWETTAPTPGVFDTVIVDEASQAGIEALALLLLAKRIIVVGDDKQNSPEAVGIREDDIARLAGDCLGEFRFREEFRPDTSLYDHAERAFGNVISLREHFRCVPEIIRFSNDLCYTDAPLIPLRQPPPKRLSPLKSQFVHQGACEGEGQRIINRAEAEAIAERIRACIDDKAYEGKTMGVIVLQGHAQAEFIERKLAEMLDSKVREERKLRCGVPATFQGDQRDVIFLSLVVAPNHNFRTLTGLDYKRRFNVAMSRARDQVTLSHSVGEHDLNPEDLRWRLLHFFSSSAQLDAVYEELDRLEREALRRPRGRGSQPDPYESWFEVDVALELLRRNYRVRPQYEVADYRIDFVVEGVGNRLAVECDGEAWHGTERFGQDAARQRRLERAGWTFVRVRESEYYTERDRAVRRIMEACKDLDIRPIGREGGEITEESEEVAPSVTAGEARLAEHEDDEEPDEHWEPEKELPSEIEGGLWPAPSAKHSQESRFPDPRSAAETNVRTALRQIIERGGPLTKRLLFKLYIERCPTLHRAGKAVKSLLSRALYGMQKAGEIVVEDELGDLSLESQVLRLTGAPRVRERPAGQRDLLEIPPSELFLVLDRLPGPAADSMQSDEAVMRKLLEHYRCPRLTEARRRYLAKILEGYRRRGLA